MTKYVKIVSIVAIPDDAIGEAVDHQMVAAELSLGMQDLVDNAGCYLLDTSHIALQLVESDWLNSVTSADDEDDEDDDPWSWETPPTARFTVPIINKAEEPQGIPILNMGGVDPQSPEGQDIIQAFCDATIPEPDADDAT